MKQELTPEQLEVKRQHQADAIRAEALRLHADFDPERLQEMVKAKKFFMGVNFAFKTPVWGAEASIAIDLKETGWEVSISWSSTQRSVSSAVAAISIYNRAIEFAALAEGILAR